MLLPACHCLELQRCIERADSPAVFRCFFAIPSAERSCWQSLRAEERRMFVKSLSCCLLYYCAFHPFVPRVQRPVPLPCRAIDWCADMSDGNCASDIIIIFHYESHSEHRNSGHPRSVTSDCCRRTVGEAHQQKASSALTTMCLLTEGAQMPPHFPSIFGAVGSFRPLQSRPASRSQRNKDKDAVAPSAVQVALAAGPAALQSPIWGLLRR